MSSRVLVAAACLCVTLAGCDDPFGGVVVEPWSALDAGGWLSCALTDQGEQYCWGGIPGFVDPPPPAGAVPPITALPRLVPASVRFSSLAVGERVVCALTEGGAAWCWGPNQHGELGDGTLLPSLSPVPVIGGHSWTMLSAGSSHVCGVRADGAALCWGNEFRGALGNGGGESPGVFRSHPVAVLGGLAFTQVRAGHRFSCGLTVTGDAYCWGANDSGQLGDGGAIVPASQRSVPSRVVGNLAFSAITTGEAHACGISAREEAYCWGLNVWGQLGNGGTSSSSLPVRVPGTLRWRQLAAGLEHTCGLTTSGRLYCWGRNEEGQLGDGTTESRLLPVASVQPQGIVGVHPGGRHTCALGQGGSVHCWGEGEFGQLGSGDFLNRTQPVRVAR